MLDNHTGIGHVVRCNHHSKPGKGGCGFFSMRNVDRFYNGKRNDIQGKMNGLEKLIGQMTDDVREINGILKARSRELDRRAKFDEEIIKPFRVGTGRNSPFFYSKKEIKQAFSMAAIGEMITKNRITNDNGSEN